MSEIGLIMACMREDDDDFKLPLRPWLEKQISSRKFRGLEWIPNEDCQKMFKLPWVKKKLPNWEEYSKIFKAWAEHRKRGSPVTEDDSKLKSNFRCALNKSDDFEEMKDKSQMDQQTGNYKVYRILKPEEVMNKKRKKSKPACKDNSVKGSVNPNLDSGAFKTIDKKVFDLLADGSMETENMEVDTNLLSYASTDVYSSMCEDNIPYDISFNNMEVQSPPDDQFNAVLAISPGGNNVWINPEDNISAEQRELTELSPPVVQENPVVPGMGSDINSYGASQYSNNTVVIVGQLEKCGIPHEKLCEFDIVIAYNGKPVYNATISNMDEGCRILYGKSDDQVKLLEMRNATEEKLSDYRYRPIQLPDCHPDRKHISAILSKTDLGLVLKYNPESMTLNAKRLCQSQIFHFNTHDSSPAIPVKLEREHVYDLYSHQKYVVEYLRTCLSLTNYTNTPTKALETAIHLVVGIKPKLYTNLESINGVRITLIPYVSRYLAANKDSSSSSLSLCFSNPTSIEECLRQLGTVSANYG